MRTRVALLVIGVLGLALTAPVAAKVAGSPHDFRSPQYGGPNTKYPNLAALAVKDPCAACHRSHAAVKGDALFGEDYGWTPTSSRISLPNSALCMSCHDGKATFGTAEEKVPDEKTIAKQHPRHRVEFFYPAAPGLVSTPGPVYTDERGRAYVRAAGGLVLLPLYKDEKTGRLKAGCGTCHDPHGPGTPSMLRTASQRQLCRVCHGAAEEKAPATRSNWSQRWAPGMPVSPSTPPPAGTP